MPLAHGTLYWLRIQATEPSSVEEGVVWLDTSTTPATVKRRTADATWETVAGGPGGSGDLTYVHVQGSPSTSWAVNHMLGKYPAVAVVDGSGNEIEAAVTYDDDDHLTLTFTSAVTGSAFAN